VIFADIEVMSPSDTDETMKDLAYRAANKAAELGLSNINAGWIAAQWKHESAGWSSALFKENCNSGGLTQEEPNGEENHQPDGNFYYKVFESYEDYADFFGRYLGYFKDSNIQEASTLDEYIEALKNSPSGAYFGDTIENYKANCHMRLVELYGRDE
jgi:hypothetical protein